ncbi:transcriptional regulator [Streptomyces albireticuli]|uniref:Transcriptional regulator n=2 Tax=Streptomyces albireticuli TaxID=1940 RepID=A0A2A2D2G1_9ACTN|nr:transcriptional regulator [Streptomyces albireticuli]
MPEPTAGPTLVPPSGPPPDPAAGPAPGRAGRPGGPGAADADAVTDVGIGTEPGILTGVVPTLGAVPTLGRGLARLVERAVRCAPDSCGASTTAVTDEEPEPCTAATHPDLSALVAVQLETGEGPVPEALGSGTPATAEDLLHDHRWPRYRARALDAGLRSSATLVFRRDSLDLALTVYGFRPGCLDAPCRGAAEELGDLAASGFDRDRRYRAALAEVDQLDTALRRRPAVDQARGIVMCALGCDADEALAVLRRHSQHTNLRLAEVADTVIATRGQGLGRTLGRA